jgi:hypothetical protein
MFFYTLIQQESESVKNNTDDSRDIAVQQNTSINGHIVTN